MRSNRDVLISGASVAGPALAYWLHRHGFRPTLVERAPAPRPGGQAVDLRGTARQVAERMGILPAIRAAHTGVVGMAFVDGDGRWLATMTNDMFGDSGGPIADLEILRGDLVRILYDATRADVEYVLDDTITAITPCGDRVEVSFERSPPRRFDLVIGADGVHSTVRRLVFGPETDFIRDLGAYVSIFTVDDASPAYDGWHLMHGIADRDGGKTAGLYPTRDGRGKAMFFFASPPIPHDRRDLAAQQKILARAFAGAGWEVPRLLEAMRDAPDFYFDRIGQVHMEAWSRGRVALLGDAGYCGSPMAGNGTSMALVGAYVLAGELAVAPDHTTAFARYERTMRDYVTRCQRFAKDGASTLLPRSAAGMWLRNQAIRVLPYMPWRNLMVGDLQKTANAVVLADY